AQRARDLRADLHGVVQGHLLLPLEPLAERFAGDVRHRIVQEAIRLTGVVERQDVRMVELGGNLDFAQEPRGTDRSGDFGTQDLDGDGPAVLLIQREVHDGHAAPAQLPLYAVASGETLAQSGGDGVARWHGVQSTPRSFASLRTSVCLRRLPKVARSGAADVAISRAEYPVQAPGTGADGGYIEEQEAVDDGQLTVVQEGPNSLPEVHKEIGDRHLSCRDEGHGSREEPQKKEETSRRFDHSGQSVEGDVLDVSDAPGEAEQLLRAVRHVGERGNDAKETEEAGAHGRKLERLSHPHERHGSAATIVEDFFARLIAAGPVQWQTRHRRHQVDAREPFGPRRGLTMRQDESADSLPS